MYTAFIIISIILAFIFVGSIIIFLKRETIKNRMIEKEAFSSGPDAVFALGLIYLEGINVTKDVVKAEEYFKKAVDMGSAQAQFYYACRLLSKTLPDISNLSKEDIESLSNEVQESLALAFELIVKSADSGNVSALTTLGTLYSEGKFVDKDVEKSVNFFLRAAEKGDVFSQLTVAGIYHFSLEADKCVAYAWYSDAATYGSPYAKNMADTIYAELNDEDKERATLLAEEYIKLFPPKCDTSNSVEKISANEESLNIEPKDDKSIN